VLNCGHNAATADPFAQAFMDKVIGVCHRDFGKELHYYELSLQDSTKIDAAEWPEILSKAQGTFVNLKVKMLTRHAPDPPEKSRLLYPHPGRNHSNYSQSGTGASSDCSNAGGLPDRKPDGKQVVDVHEGKSCYLNVDYESTGFNWKTDGTGAIAAKSQEVTGKDTNEAGEKAAVQGKINTKDDKRLEKEKEEEEERQEEKELQTRGEEENDEAASVIKSPQNLTDNVNEIHNKEQAAARYTVSWQSIRDKILFEEPDPIEDESAKMALIPYTRNLKIYPRPSRKSTKDSLSYDERTGRRKISTDSHTSVKHHDLWKNVPIMQENRLARLDSWRGVTPPDKPPERLGIRGNSDRMMDSAIKQYRYGPAPPTAPQRGKELYGSSQALVIRGGDRSQPPEYRVDFDNPPPNREPKFAQEPLSDIVVNLPLDKELVVDVDYVAGFR
jgi:hypothetical protein